MYNFISSFYLKQIEYYCKDFVFLNSHASKSSFLGFCTPSAVIVKYQKIDHEFSTHNVDFQEGNIAPKQQDEPFKERVTKPKEVADLTLHALDIINLHVIH